LNKTGEWRCSGTLRGSERSNKLPDQENGENLPYPDDDDLNCVLIVLERLLVLVVGSFGDRARV